MEGDTTQGAGDREPADEIEQVVFVPSGQVKVREFGQAPLFGMAVRTSEGLLLWRDHMRQGPE